MIDRFQAMPNGYQESIQRGIAAINLFSGKVAYGTPASPDDERIARLSRAIRESDAILIGAGAGLSTSAGYTYSGPRFEKYFGDFARAYGIRDMYSGGFFPYPTKEEFWAYWARYIYINRYADPPKPVYDKLLSLVEGTNYFVVTTNVDHCFQRAGFDKKRLFYTQGDYGLFQSSNPGNRNTYDNEQWVREALLAQGFVSDAEGHLDMPADGALRMAIPQELVPHCPDDGSEAVMNLRSDDTFAEDEGWHRASAAYSDFLRRYASGRILLWELGVGGNTPVIVKYPFWQMARDNPDAVYSCLNYREAYCPVELKERSICIDGDIGDVLDMLQP